MAHRPNEKNERVKRRFIDFRKFSKQLSEKSLDRELNTLERFDVWNGRKDLARFHIEWAMGFRTHLENTKSMNGNPLAKSTTRAIMATMREFTVWLSMQDGFRKRIKITDADYFDLSHLILPSPPSGCFMQLVGWALVHKIRCVPATLMT